jgi:hypothetical protein
MLINPSMVLMSRQRNSRQNQDTKIVSFKDVAQFKYLEIALACMKGLRVEGFRVQSFEEDVWV